MQKGQWLWNGGKGGAWIHHKLSREACLLIQLVCPLYSDQSQMKLLFSLKAIKNQRVCLETLILKAFPEGGAFYVKLQEGLMSLDLQQLWLQ